MICIYLCKYNHTSKYQHFLSPGHNEGTIKVLSLNPQYDKCCDARGVSGAPQMDPL